MAGNGWLTPSNINDVFKELDRSLEKKGGHVEMYVAGGARMLLGLRTDRSTEDIDGIIRTGRKALERAAEEVGTRHGAKPGWINERMWTAIPRVEDSRARTLYEGRHLKIIGASPEHMLAMKLRATRAVDAADADAIIRVIDIRDTGSALAIAEKVYQADGNRARLEILKGVERLAQRQPHLTRTHGPAGDDDGRERDQPDDRRPELEPADTERIRIGGNPADATPVRAKRAGIGGKLENDKRTKKPTTDTPADDEPSGYER